MFKEIDNKLNQIKPEEPSTDKLTQSFHSVQQLIFYSSKSMILSFML